MKFSSFTEAMQAIRKTVKKPKSPVRKAPADPAVAALPARFVADELRRLVKRKR
jgi:hypothetical protein